MVSCFIFKISRYFIDYNINDNDDGNNNNDNYNIISPVNKD